MTFAQSLPLGGKVLATLVVTAVWFFVCYAIWQKPRAATSTETRAPTVSVGDVSSQNQTGGVTAGYIGDAGQKK